MGGRTRRKKRRTPKQPIKKKGTPRWLWPVLTAAFAFFGYQALFHDRENAPYTPRPDRLTTEAVEPKESELEAAASEPGAWDFLANGPNIPENMSEHIHRGVQIGPKFHYTDPYEIKQIMGEELESIDSGLQELGYSIDDVSFALETLYGYPTSPEYMDPLVDYCEQAFAFMQSRINGFTCDEIELLPLKPGDNYATDSNAKAFVGEFYFRDFEIVAQNKTGDQTSIHLVHKYNGALMQPFHERKEDGKISEEESLTIFIGRGASTTVAPFSELIPYCVRDLELKYEKEVGEDDAAIVGETFSEAVSYTLATELIDNLGIPNGHRYLDEVQIGMNSEGAHSAVYEYVPEAIEWVQEHSVQEAYNLYTQEGPAAFMEAIQESVE